MTQIRVEEDFLQKAGEGEFCFAEDADLSGEEERIQEIYLYRWNRDYPADVYFPGRSFRMELCRNERVCRFVP